MPEQFLVARNPDPDSTLPYLLRVPIDNGIVLRAKATWPTPRGCSASKPTILGRPTKR